MGDRMEWITGRARFDEVAAQWERLADAGRRGPFVRHAWLSAWLDAFGPVQLQVCVLWRDDEMAAAIPLRTSRHGAMAIANVHTPFMVPLGLDAASIRELYSRALDDSPELVLQPIPEAFVRENQLVETARDAGVWTVVESGATSPLVDTSTQVESWIEGSKPRWGAPLERFRRKAIRERAAEFALAYEPEDLEAELDACFAVEASGWKGEQGTAILSHPETATFYRRIATDFHAQGKLRLSTVRFDGSIAAFDLCLLHERRLYLLKTGFDESARKLAPGLLLQLSLIEHCFERDVEAFELLGDEEEWKLKFATGERRHVALWAFRRGPGGGGRYLYRAGLRPRLRRARQSLRRLRR